MTQATSTGYEIKLPLFEGPFDLLLFFIERDELDIYDIPISKITDDFLAYVRQLELLNIDLASEFIWVAATLMRIKSRMLLPRPQVNEKGEEVDPRDELVRHLLEYKKYKSVIGELSQLEDERALRHNRGNIEAELKSLMKNTGSEVELQSLDLYKLLRVYQRAMTAYELELNRPRHTIVQYPYTIEDQKSFLVQRVQGQRKVSFAELLAEAGSRILAIFNFLAVLELLQLQQVSVVIGEGYNNFWIIPKEDEVVMAPAETED